LGRLCARKRLHSDGAHTPVPAIAVAIAGRLKLGGVSSRRWRTAGLRLEEIRTTGTRDVPLDAVDDIEVADDRDDAEFDVFAAGTG
jgi:hypothetical protein